MPNNPTPSLTSQLPDKCDAAPVKVTSVPVEEVVPTLVFVAEVLVANVVVDRLGTGVTATEVLMAGAVADGMISETLWEADATPVVSEQSHVAEVVVTTTTLSGVVYVAGTVVSLASVVVVHGVVVWMTSVEVLYGVVVSFPHVLVAVC